MLAAALDPCAEKGLHNVSIHEIAREAEFAVGAPYRFFIIREDLCQALIQSRAGGLHARLKVTFEQPEGKDRLAVPEPSVEAKTAWLSGGAAIWRLCFAGTPGASVNIIGGPDLGIRERYYDLAAGLARLFHAGVRQWIFRPPALCFMAVAPENLTNGFLQCRIGRPGRCLCEANAPLVLDASGKWVLRKSISLRPGRLIKRHRFG